MTSVSFGLLCFHEDVCSHFDHCSLQNVEASLWPLLRFPLHSLVLINLIMMCFGAVFILFYVLCFLEPVCFKFLLNLEKLQPLFLQTCFLFLLTIFSLELHVYWLREVPSSLPDWCSVHFFQLFSFVSLLGWFCCYIWIC